MSGRSTRLPLVLVTLGDPAGIGPEVAVRAVQQPAVRRRMRPVILGHPSIVERTLRHLGLPVRVHVLDRLEAAGGDPEPILVWPVAGLRCPRFHPGRTSPALGRLVLSALDQAIDLALAGQVDAICTGPICKAAVEAVRPGFVGHTEYLAQRTGSRHYCMMLSAGRLRLTFVTGHCALSRVPRLVTRRRLEVVIGLTVEALRRLGVGRPRVAVAGLNPHAGEAGLFGREEQRIIAPTVRSLRRRWPGLSGPHPPDALFRLAWRGEFDAVVCLYHDQGHIPLKMVALERGVNTTLGLPIVRTSPDHGTAFDIAGRGVADPRSMREALGMAARLARGRLQERTAHG